MPRGERALIYFYILRSRCLSFSDSPESSPRSPRVHLSLSFLSTLPSSVGGLEFFCMPALSGSYGVHVKRMKSPERIEGVYWVMIGGASTGLRVQRSALSASSFQAQGLRYVVYSLNAEAPADNL